MVVVQGLWDASCGTRYGTAITLLLGNCHALVSPMIFIRKGIIWIVVAIVAEVTPAVSKCCFLYITPSPIVIYSQVFICLDLNRIVVSLVCY